MGIRYGGYHGSDLWWPFPRLYVNKIALTMGVRNPVLSPYILYCRRAIALSAGRVYGTMQQSWPVTDARHEIPDG